MFTGLSPQRRRFVLGSLGAAVAIVVIGIFALRSEPVARSSRVAVLLVHGYGGSTQSMQRLASALDAQHLDAQAVALPQHGKADISRSAQVLADAVDATGDQKVDLVGFSAGSIVVRSYVGSAMGRIRTNRVVLLGAPNHGADIASLAIATDPSSCVDACQQLAPGSGFLRALNAHPVPGGISFTSIWTADDKTVTPPDSAVLTGATNLRVQDLCPKARLAHSDLVTDPITIGLTIVALGSHPDELRGCSQVRQIGINALSS